MHIINSLSSLIACVRFVLVMPRGGLSPRDNDDGNYVTDVTEECTRDTGRNYFHFHGFTAR